MKLRSLQHLRLREMFRKEVRRVLLPEDLSDLQVLRFHRRLQPQVTRLQVSELTEACTMDNAASGTAIGIYRD